MKPTDLSDGAKRFLRDHEDDLKKNLVRTVIQAADNESHRYNIEPGEIACFFLAAGIDLWKFYEKIPAHMFQGGDCDKEFVIPEGITEIGMQAFKDCTKLKRVSIPDTVTKIGREAFKNTSIYEIELPDSITSLGNNVFNDDIRRIIVSPRTMKNRLSVPKKEIEWYKDHIFMRKDDGAN